MREPSPRQHGWTRYAIKGGRGIRAGRIAAAAAVAVTLAAGCATIPSSGGAQSTPTPPAALGGSGVDCCQQIWRPPQPNWGPQEVVTGFLLASANSAHNYALARQYLTKPARQAWRPRSKVTILGGTPNVTLLPGQISGAGGQRAVLVTVQEFGTLSSGGHYRTTAPGSSATRQFTLQRVSGRYLIALLPSENPGQPSQQLFLDSDLFPQVYQARNLYFFGVPGQSLVPDPVFVPARYGNPAGQLINDLRQDPGGWLQSAAHTAVPADTELAKPVQLLPSPSGGKTAMVDLHVPGTLTGDQKQAIATQVATTLTSRAYGSALCQAVRLRINGRLWPAPPHDQLLSAGNLSQSIPHWRGNAAVYYLSTNGSPRTLSGLDTRGVPLPGETGGLSRIAVSPDGKYIAGLSASGSTISVGSLAGGSSGQHPPVGLRPRLSGAFFTAMSWDGGHDLWVAGRLRHSPGLWMLPPTGKPVRVQLPSGLAPISALRVAPDGVRVAMAVGTGRAAQLVLGAIVRLAGNLYIPSSVVPLGPGLTGVTALAWYDEDQLLVVAGGSGKGLSLVPANGANGRHLPGQNGIVSVTAAGPQNPMYVSLASGQVEKSVGIGEFWNFITDGRAVTYPG